ncbi:MAG TPA: hypothetical protein ENN43_09110 [bacterium]|nr:hypothetical protein [bacterium]
MKKAILLFSLIFVVISISFASATPAAEAEEAEKPGERRIFIQVGALEQKDRDKFILRRMSGQIEFYTDEKTNTYIRTEGSKESAAAGTYISVRGPKNANAILANAVYVYRDKDEFDEFNSVTLGDGPAEGAGISEERGVVLEQENVFEALDEELRPLLIGKDGGKKVMVSFDEGTYWVFIEKKDEKNLAIADRLKLYFDRRLSVRQKSIPIKIVADRIKAGY